MFNGAISIPDAIDLATQIVAGASVLAAVIPQPYSGYLVALRKVLDFAAMNWGNAKNATNPQPSGSLIRVEMAPRATVKSTDEDSGMGGKW